MSQHRAADHRPPESQLWHPEPSYKRGGEQHGVEQHDIEQHCVETPGVDQRGVEKNGAGQRRVAQAGAGKRVVERPGVSRPRADGRNASGHRQEKRGTNERRGANERGGGDERRGVTAPVRPGGGPLTAFGVSIVLAGACLIGASLDLLLVSTAAWGLTGLFLAACAYTAAKVRRSDWYSAVVGPPLAFACGLLLVAAFSPHDIGSGLTGTLATILELLAYKARAVFFGTALALCVTLARKLPFARP